MNIRKCALAVGTTALIIFLAGCSRGEETKGKLSTEKESQGSGKKGRTRVVAAASIKRAPITKTLQLTGTVEPERTARLASPVEGPVQTLWVREGDTVRGGKILLDIGRKGAVNAQLAAARENLRSRELEMERVKKLAEEDAVSKSELDEARTQYKNARAQHAHATESSADFRIRAPWRGIISEVIVEEGDFLVPRAQVLKMYDPDGLIVVSSVPETRARQIRKSASVELKFDAYPGIISKGYISRVYPRLDSKNRTRKFEVTVDDTISLIPGMFARLRVEISKADSALIVPKKAVVSKPKNKQFVYIVKDKKVHSRPVVTGIQADSLIQIKDGLSGGETVVIEGNEKLKDGAKVRVKEAKEKNIGKDKK